MQVRADPYTGGDPDHDIISVLLPNLNFAVVNGNVNI